MARKRLGTNMDQYPDPNRIHLCSVANPQILVPIHMPGWGNHGSLPEKQPPRNPPRPYQMLKLQGMRNRMSHANTDSGPGLEEVQRLGMHPLHGVH
jgi:hypothetical protein